VDFIITSEGMASKIEFTASMTGDESCLTDCAGGEKLATNDNM
jgi:hypothetical protein